MTASAAEQTKAQAQALLQEGNLRGSEGDFGAALVKYRQAYALYPSAKLLLNIGTALRHVGRNAEAARTYERYLAHPEATPERTAELQRILSEIEQVVARLEIEINQPGARVRLDGAPLELPRRQRSVRVDPGEHTVVAEKPGFTTVVRTVTVQHRQRVPIELVLSKPGEAPPVVIDRTDGSTQRVVGYVVGGTGLAGLVVGAVFGGLSLSTDADADEHCVPEDPSICDPEGARLAETAQTQGTTATILLVAGGVATTAGLIIWLTAPSDDSDSSPTATVILHPSRGGLALSLGAAW